MRYLIFSLVCLSAVVSACGGGGEGGTPGADAGAVISSGDADDSGPSDTAQLDAGSEAGSGPCSYLPSNIDLSTIDFTGVEDVVLTHDQTIETDLGGVLVGTGRYTYQEIPQTNGPNLGVFAVKSLTIPPGVTARAEGADALVIVALGDIVIEGTLRGNSASSTIYAKGPGAYQQPDHDNQPGSGPGGGGAGSLLTSAGGAGYCGVGGNGASLSGSASKGGASWGTAALVPLVAGSSGGEGGVGRGGNGGGAIQLSACGALQVSGLINVGGEGGSGSGVYDSSNQVSQQASGGGSGGSLLLQGMSVNVTGTLAANGGGGGGTTAGADATGDAQPAPGGTSNMTTKAAGGAGAAGATIDGQPGQTQAASTSGGGGGAVGRIRISAKPSQATLGGTLSPPLGPCTTLGSL